MGQWTFSVNFQFQFGAMSSQLQIDAATNYVNKAKQLFK